MLKETLGLVGGFFGCVLLWFFPHPCLYRKSLSRKLAEPESSGWMLSHVKVTAQITGAQEVSKEIIPAPELTQQVPGSPLLTSETGQKAKRMPICVEGSVYLTFGLK